MDDVLSVPRHEFFGKAVDMHRCLPTPTRTEAENLSYKVFVGGIDETITQEVLREALMPFGQVRNVNIIRLPDGRLKGFAFVQFMEQGPVDMLIQRQNLMVNGRRLYFGSATAKKNNPNQQYVMILNLFFTFSSPFPGNNSYGYGYGNSNGYGQRY